MVSRIWDDNATDISSGPENMVKNAKDHELRNLKNKFVNSKLLFFIPLT